MEGGRYTGPAAGKRAVCTAEAERIPFHTPLAKEFTPDKNGTAQSCSGTAPPESFHREEMVCFSDPTARFSGLCSERVPDGTNPVPVKQSPSRLYHRAPSAEADTAEIARRPAHEISGGGAIGVYPNMPAFRFRHDAACTNEECGLMDWLHLPLAYSTIRPRPPWQSVLCPAFTLR